MLPSHLQRYNGLIDLLVEMIVRDIEQDAKPPDQKPEVSGNPVT
jgi:hypothetical protein